ncbi:MAG: chromosome partitioning protein ParB, partial [Halanaerobium sp. MSAO_Bac5]
MIRLLKLSDKVLKHLEKGTITVGHARALLGLDIEAQGPACENIIIKDLTVRATEKYVEELKNPTHKNKKKAKNSELSQEWTTAAEKIAESLGSKVKIKSRKKNKLLTIEIESIEKLEEIIAKLN